MRPVSVVAVIVVILGLGHALPTHVTVRKPKSQDDNFPWGDANVAASEMDGNKRDTGMAAAMASSTADHMIGNSHSHESTTTTRETATRQLTEQVRAEDEQIAEMTEELDGIRAEQGKVSNELARLQAANKKKREEVEKEHSRRLEKLKSVTDEHLASVKKELAMGVKKVRVDSGRHLEKERERLQADLQESRHSFDDLKDRITGKIEESRNSAQETDAKAEKIFQQYRDDWKAKHQKELERKGVKGELDEAKATTNHLTEQLQALEKLKGDAKEHLKKAVQSKLLLAAKLKNLRAREVSLEGKEEAMAKDNAQLSHELDEVRFTQAENEGEMAKAVSKATKAKATYVETAKADAEQAEITFKETTLKKAQDEIDELKQQLDKYKRHDERSQRELMEQERSVQAEMKEASDALDKVKWDVQVAEQQNKLELSAARDQAMDIVDEARRKAAGLREHARNKGMADSEKEYREAVEHQKEVGGALQQEEKGVDQLTVEFEEKTKRQIQQKEMQTRENIDAKRRKMDEELQAAAQEKVEDFRREEERKLGDIQRQYRETESKVEATELNVKQLSQTERALKKQTEQLQKAMVRDKAEWTYKQVMSKFPQ